jgi:ribosomal protein S18 acetylase RimI-like enzyme
MNLRRAALNDAPALARVNAAAWQAAYRGIVPDSYLQRFTVEQRTGRFTELLAADSGETCAETHAAESNHEIVGFLILGRCRDPDVDRKTTGEIWGIYVSPEHWREGVGRLLCQQGQSILAGRGYSTVTLWVLEANQEARMFYEAMGFRPDGANKELRLGAAVKAVRYRKQLEPAEQRDQAGE